MGGMSPGRLLAIVYFAVGLSIGLMKTLFPTVFDLIGSSCLVLVGLSLLAVFLIFWAGPYMQCCNSASTKIEIVSTPKIKNELRSYKLPPICQENELDFTSDRDTSSIDKDSIANSESVTVDIQNTEVQPQMKTSQTSVAPIFSVAIDMDTTELRRM